MTAIMASNVGPTKLWWQSKTIWVNAVAAALVALQAGTGVLQPYLPVSLYAAVAFGLPIVNAVLRVVTTQGLSK